MVACEDAGGHLANVGSDSRTSFLASLVSSALANHTASYRKAFVGLFSDGGFVAVTGEPLNCLPFRAWAPGHPKANKLKKDCTVVTSNRYWKTVDCTLKLPYICELISDGPLSPVERYCAPISNEKRRKNCILRNHKQFQNVEQSNQIKYQCFDSNINKKTIEVTDNN
ncbi:Hypothetical protein CINCED_3A023927 [Cinara cedri]|uniref:C-type lectin domain-containing protein n=1 Tax=Cinara cedri TaxID=506608 RepID=A0A5E4M9D9_9HEMI|nr:Hypothetical protein CINCED_3A023927 [Cinara cedri]